MPLARQNIVCFSTADWDTLLPTNKHHLMRRLARRGNRVLFVETLGTRRPNLASSVDVTRIARRLRRGIEGPRKREQRLWTLSPVVRPAWNSTVSRAANRIAFRTQSAKALAHFPQPIAWVYSPYAVHLLRDVNPRLVVYHMVDDLSAVPGADRDALREAEAHLIARADCVFCTERSLYDRARLINSQALFMPNVADFRHFARPHEDVRDDRLAKLRDMPRPRIVFSGHIAPHKVDLDLVVQLAIERPHFSFVLIGPQWEGGKANAVLNKLRMLVNVTFLGHVPYHDLPAYLHESDVLVIPYVDNEATRAVFPLKFFEYMATGKPVIASPLPSLLAYEKAILLAETKDEWLAAMDRALREPEDMSQQRRTLARRYTWDVRLREMEEAIDEATGRRG